MHLALLLATTVGAAIYASPGPTDLPPLPGPTDTEQPSKPSAAESPPEGPPAAPRPAEPENARRSLWLEGSLGMGTPLGWAGVGVAFEPARFVALHAGLGLGTQGFQFGAGARGRVPVSRTMSLGLGLGWSTGAFAGIAGPHVLPDSHRKAPAVYYWDRAHFLNVEGSLEHRRGRLTVRPFLGVQWVLNGDDGILVNCANGGVCDRTRARIVPYLGCALAFGVL